MLGTTGTVVFGGFEVMVGRLDCEKADGGSVALAACWIGRLGAGGAVAVRVAGVVTCSNAAVDKCDPAAV